MTSRIAAATKNSLSPSTGTQADLDREFRTIEALPEQIQSNAHGAHAHTVNVGLPVAYMTLTEALRHQEFDRSPYDIIVWKSEYRARLTIRVANGPGLVNDNHRVRRGVECTAGQLGGDRAHMKRPNRLGSIMPQNDLVQHSIVSIDPADPRLPDDSARKPDYKT